MDNLIIAKNKVLTSLGLKFVNELKINDLVYSFNANKNIFELDYIKNVQKVENIQDFYEIKTTCGSFYVDKNNIVFKLKLGNFNNVYGYEKYIATDFVDNLNINDYLIQPTNLCTSNSVISKIDLFPIIKDLIQNYHPRPKSYLEDDKIWICREASKFLSLNRFINAFNLVSILAWYICEGYSKKDCFTRHNKDGSKYRSEFCQSLKANLDKVDLIKSSLLQSDIPAKFQFSKVCYNGIPKEMTIYMSNVMAVLCQSCGCYSFEKHIPKWLMEILLQDINLREQFLYILSLGDGFRTNSRYPGFCSISPKLLEDVISLIQLSGYHFTLQNTKTKTKYIIYSKLGTKSALISLGNAKFCKILEINLVKYNIDIYKIQTTKNGNLLIGDYGQILVKI